MSRRRVSSWLAGLCLVAAAVLPLDAAGLNLAATSVPAAFWTLALAAGVLGLRRPAWAGLAHLALFLAAEAAALLLVIGPIARGDAGSGLWSLVLAGVLAAWSAMADLTEMKLASPTAAKARDLAVPAIFGLALIASVELVLRGAGVPSVLLPAPSSVAGRFVAALPMLMEDLVQTFVKGVLVGYVLGNATGFLIAVLVQRSHFLERGLLPLGNFISSLPIVGIAPIMVMWFGFDWPSKAAVVAIVTFFPMLANAVAGLSSASRMDLDLMHSYGASFAQTLIKLRLPASLPFVFNALKINSTLALIGAIVAEFFGTPIRGMGFRISIEAARMSMDVVWAEILLAALVGTAFYGCLVLIERTLTFWHPSQRT